MTSPEPLSPPAPEKDLHAELLDGFASLSPQAPLTPSGRFKGAPRSSRPSAPDAVTSDLSIDEVLLLHSIGWEPVDLVCGASVVSVLHGVWRWGQGEIEGASYAHTRAVATAVERVGSECASLGGDGVVGVKLELRIQPHHIDAVLVGTAVRDRARQHRGGTAPFVSDLSTRDFVLLHNAGWEPLGLAFGAAFLYAPRRSAAKTIQQKSQNVELTNFTDALYAARESAMERMQTSARQMGASGVVAVRITDGPVRFASHAVGFTAWGTAVGLGEAGHRYLRPRVVVPLDDPVASFDARALRGEPPTNG